MTNEMPSSQNNQRYSRSSRPRKHMGTASSEAEYLPLTERSKQGLASVARGDKQSSVRINNAKLKSTTRQSGRYLQVPNNNKTIFVNAQVKKRQQSQKVVIFAAVLVLFVLVVLWFLFLR